LIGLLHQYGIKYLIDVRSRPYSGYNPQYNREHIAAYLQQNSISYVYMGHLLGGHPPDGTCYTDDRIDYRKVRTKDFYLNGIARLATAYQKQIPVAIMCSEAKPQNCHRAKLISDTLVSNNIYVQHVDEAGLLKSHAQVSALYTGKARNVNGTGLFTENI